MPRATRIGILVVAMALLCLGVAMFWPRAVPVAAATDMRATPGCLQVTDRQGKVVGMCPLKHTDVDADVSGFIARVKVTQKFQNPYKEKIEAVYTFPLSQDAAVDNMTMIVGDREVRGEIKRKEEARQIYEDAKNAGHVASLLDQERPNIFTQSVANIMPGESVTITISYVETLKFTDGWFQFTFPTVVGPRYIPGQPTSRKPDVPVELQGQVVQPKVRQGAGAPSGTGWSPDTDRVPDASRITPQVTAPGTRSGHDISINVRIDAGDEIRDIESKLHDVDIDRDGGTAIVSLKDKAAIPNKDFILRYTTASANVGDAVLTHASQLGRFVMLVLQPPDRVRPAQVTPKEMVFVLDTSGSMQGPPIETAKQTMLHCLRNLNSRDTFNVITFSGDTRIFFDKPVPATSSNIAKAQQYLAEQQGGGGTEMMKAIRAALDPSDSQEHLRIVCFMTDGYVGNDMEIIGEVQKHPNARIFSFGVGDSPNRFLLDNMARAGRGEVEYVNLGEPGDQVANRFYERLRNPVLTDIEVDWGDLPVTEGYPQRIPDLFSSKPVVVVAQATGSGRGEVVLRGRIAGQRFERRVHVDLPNREPGHDVLASLWARQKIESIMNEDWLGLQLGKPQSNVQQRIIDLGLKYRLVTQYTSFVAVEWMTVTDGGVPKKVPVPVEMPQGVSYEGVFGDSEMESAPRLGFSSMSGAGRGAVYKRATLGGGGGFGGGGMPGGMPASPAPISGPQGPAGPASASVEMAIKGTAVTSGAVDAATSAAPQRTDASSRLSPELRTLLQRAKGQGAKSNLSVPGLKVKNGLVEVSIWLSSDSDADIAKLKRLGMQVLGRARSVKMLIARLPVNRLEEAARLGFVRRIEPALTGTK